MTVAQAFAAAQRGDVVGAARMLEAAAVGGDGEAAFALAEWRLAGDPIRRDLALARQWYGRAAELGVAEAGPIYTALLANGAGGSGRRWSDALDRVRGDPGEWAIIDAMRLNAEGDPVELPPATTLCEAPLIRSFSGFLSSGECRYLARLAEPQLQPSVVIDPQSGRMIQHPIRTADSVGFPFVSESPALHAINRRIAAVTGTDYAQGEPVQILSYAPGQEYRLHSDAIAGEANQRSVTMLVCLEDDFDGGETIFPRLDISWRGRAGDALTFANIDAAGRPDPLAWHAGCPVTRGRKLILSKWIRAAPLDLSGPTGRPL